MLIKNVCPHLDDLHDGRPIETAETAEITAKEFELEHYQSRLRDGLLVVVEPAKRKSASSGDDKETT